MKDRGMIKWRAFDSVISSTITLNKLVKERNIVAMPILSEEQLTVIEQSLKNAFYRGDKISIVYYKNGKFEKTAAIIKEIDSIYHKIILSNAKKIYFQQIVNVNYV